MSTHSGWLFLRTGKVQWERVFGELDGSRLSLYVDDSKQSLARCSENPIQLTPSTAVQEVLDFVVVSKSGEHVSLVVEEGEESASQWYKLLVARAAAAVEPSEACSPATASTTDDESKGETSPQAAPATRPERSSPYALPYAEAPVTGGPPLTWSHGDSSLFRVRVGPNYKRTGAKAPSAGALYEIAGVDVFRSSSKIDNIASMVELPDISHIEAMGGTNNPHVPPIFVVNMQIPTDEPSIFGNPPDGEGVHVVMYFRVTPETCAMLQDLGSALPAVQLFSEYCRLAPTSDNVRGRFKAIAYVDNMAEFGFPSFITSYNAKPALITKTGALVRGANYLEMDINVHKFNAMSRKGLAILLDYFKDMVVHFGFVIEGRDDNELPECLFGNVQLNKLDYAQTRRVSKRS